MHELVTAQRGVHAPHAEIVRHVVGAVRDNEALSERAREEERGGRERTRGGGEGRERERER